MGKMSNTTLESVLQQAVASIKQRICNNPPEQGKQFLNKEQVSLDDEKDNSIVAKSKVGGEDKNFVFSDGSRGKVRG